MSWTFAFPGSCRNCPRKPVPSPNGPVVLWTIRMISGLCLSTQSQPGKRFLRNRIFTLTISFPLCAVSIRLVCRMILLLPILPTIAMFASSLQYLPKFHWRFGHADPFVVAVRASLFQSSVSLWNALEDGGKWSDSNAVCNEHCLFRLKHLPRTSAEWAVKEALKYRNRQDTFPWKQNFKTRVLRLVTEPWMSGVPQCEYSSFSVLLFSNCCFPDWYVCNCPCSEDPLLWSQGVLSSAQLVKLLIGVKTVNSFFGQLCGHFFFFPPQVLTEVESYLHHFLSGTAHLQGWSDQRSRRAFLSSVPLTWCATTALLQSTTHLNLFFCWLLPLSPPITEQNALPFVSWSGWYQKRKCNPFC